jgi:predicted porin
LQSYSISRERDNTSATASLWANFLAGRLNVTATGGMLRTSTDQEVLFSGTTAGSNSATNYTSRAILYGVTVSARPTERLDLSLALQQVLSFAEFDPVWLSTVDTSGVKELSWTRSTENSVSFKADYALHKNVSCGVDYRYRQYKDERDSSFDGAVHAITASVTAKWR